ncbi:MAG: M13 family metallopeptidase [Muribaculaceae bacterium]|nr:M13 family metallopeptidase [Muribaculaceae bacterium]
MKLTKVTMLTLALTTAMASSAIDRKNLDTSVAPGQDFYQYACGGWMKANPLKGEYSRYGTFDNLAENNRKQVRELVENLDTRTAAKGSAAQKVGDLYAMGLDSVRLNKEGAAPMKADLERIQKMKRADLTSTLAWMHSCIGSPFFGMGVEADLKDSNTNIMYWMQGGMGLGDRDYYINDDDHTFAIREAYKENIRKTAMLAGFNPIEAARIVKNTFELESRIAEAAMTRVELRDPAASYNIFTIDQLKKDYPAVDLNGLFSQLGLANVKSLCVGQPKVLAVVNDIFANASLQQIRDYLTAHYIFGASSYLSDDFGEADFELNKVVSGAEQRPPRWKRALAIPNGYLGELVGQLYVEKYFPQSSKDKMLELVNNLKTALGQHISNVTWMSEATKAKALEKLAAFTVKIGFPDKWRDYSALTIDPTLSYWDNVKAANKFMHDINFADFGKPVDRDRWYMTPQTVNAYYSPLTNEICFPAGILQPPFFNPEADMAENYGAIGVVIGHEMTHGFDDQGRQFDKNGNMENWWTEEDATKFNALADKLVAQFDEIVVLGDTHANGRLTLGENIADQGGLRVAYTAYHNSLAGKDAPVIDGLTGDQRFYLAYANVWAANIRDAEILRRTQTDPHSLGRWRVNASLRNIQPFFDAFGIKEGDPMFRPEAERVIIW